MRMWCAKSSANLNKEAIRRLPTVSAVGQQDRTPRARLMLVDEIMATHGDLISVTLHGVPPGQTDTYTMFAGSFPDRIGNSDDPDDIDISKKGITILDPRW